MREQDLNYDSNLVAWWKQLIVGRVCRLGRLHKFIDSSYST